MMTYPSTGVVFHPSWLRHLTRVQRAEVVVWIELHGINPNYCKGFAVNKDYIRFHMYCRNDKGDVQYNKDTYEPIMEDIEVKRTKDLPSAVWSRIKDYESH